MEIFANVSKALFPNTLLNFLFKECEDEPFGREGQEGFWILQSELEEGQFPPTNAEIIRKLKDEQSQH